MIFPNRIEEPCGSMVTVFFSCPQSGKDVPSTLTIGHDIVIHKFHAGDAPGRVTEKL